ncbi:Gp49 family protein [Janthinobacterium sp. B9-8]|uniref:Gp49 family protein n=1 Tax=Janthinobacterium sp. B9-8 TaxID=1236179 RepID=UPI00061D1A72|nr:Gp49 family protein [Janthinobacterium sp. B9-8]AMC34768.1 hypothetical protein VN23_09170 [Janthinobacterium sp. B9-8]
MSETAIEQEIQEKGLTAPRITPSHIDSLIVGERYFTAADGCLGEWQYRHDTGDNAPMEQVNEAHHLLTFCVLVLKNGFTVTGESACASPENFNAEIGRKIALENARSKIWALEGYVLRNKLAGI